MRHAVAGRKLNRTTEHRVAMCRNLAQSLFQFGQVRTTIPKAKEVRGFAERLITLAIDGSLASRQRAISLLGDRAIIPAANQAEYDRMSDAKRAKVLRARSGRRYRASTTRPGVPFTAESVVHKLFADIGPAMKRRNDAKSCSGGYTRIIKLADRRLGDGSPLALLQLVSESDPKRARVSDKTERRRKAAVRYSVYAGKPRTTRGRRSAKSAKPGAASE